MSGHALEFTGDPNYPWRLICNHGPAAVPDPKVTDLGPIEKRPFDPDRVRAQQANAL